MQNFGTSNIEISIALSIEAAREGLERTMSECYYGSLLIQTLGIPGWNII